MDDDCRWLRGQALVELAIALPVLMFLAAGTLEMGRGYSFAIAASDAARDGARFLAGKTAATNGGGVAAMCSLETADLAAVTSNVSCPTVVTTKPAAGAYTPTPGQAIVVVWCGNPSDCTGTATVLSQKEVDVYVYYGFSDLNLLGGGITISGSSRATTSW
ncbi:MAG: TadE/TadG family type IV pilus assembly protein [Candidatus Limnocylindria bacterium]